MQIWKKPGGRGGASQSGRSTQGCPPALVHPGAALWIPTEQQLPGRSFAIAAASQMCAESPCQEEMYFSMSILFGVGFGRGVGGGAVCFGLFWFSLNLGMYCLSGLDLEVQGQGVGGGDASRGGEGDSLFLGSSQLALGCWQSLSLLGL